MISAARTVDLEESVVGAMIKSREARETASKALNVEDFLTPTLKAFFEAIVALHEEGLDPAEPVLSARLEDHPAFAADGFGYRTVTPRQVWSFVQGGTISTHIEAYCAELVEAVTERKLIAVGERISTDLDEGLAADDVADAARTGIDEATEGLGSTALPTTYSSVDEFLDRPDVDRSDWVIRGLMKRGWRVVLVAPEGAGKSSVLRAMTTAAQGVHPFTAEHIPPVRVLVVDLENPDDAIEDTFARIRAGLQKTAGENYDPGRAMLYREAAGLNIRSRRDRNRLEDVIADSQPDLVTIGPIYSMFRREGRETDEEATIDAQGILRDLQARHGFGLLMEHHAPHGSGGQRDLRPFGSSAWLRWPEIGIKLTPPLGAPEGDMRKLVLGRWRGDRMVNGWPTAIRRASGPGMLWVACEDTEPLPRETSSRQPPPPEPDF